MVFFRGMLGTELELHKADFMPKIRAEFLKPYTSISSHQLRSFKRELQAELFWNDFAFLPLSQKVGRPRRANLEEP